MSIVDFRDRQFQRDVVDRRGLLDALARAADHATAGIEHVVEQIGTGRETTFNTDGTVTVTTAPQPRR